MVTYRGVALSDLANGFVIKHPYRMSISDDNGGRYCNGIDFTGRFNAVWNEDVSMFYLPDRITIHHASMIYNAYHDKDYGRIRRYDIGGFDWQRVLIV